MVCIAGDLARMHCLRVVHGDFKWSNILIAPGPEPEAWFVDLDNACLRSFPGNNCYALDLARFAVDMARFLPDPKFFRYSIDSYTAKTGLKAQDVIKAMIPFSHRRCIKHKRKNKPHSISLSSLAAEVVNENTFKIK